MLGCSPSSGREMNYIKTMLCDSFIGIDKLERLKLLQSDPLINEFAISIEEPEAEGNRRHG
jgi:hypothetical protein